MKLINLLNKIANGEKLPKKIKYENDIYILDDNYYCNETNLILSDRLYAEQNILNNEVKIIEDNKIEKFPHNCFAYDLNKNEKFLVENINQLKDKVNEIIDVINEMKEGK